MDKIVKPIYGIYWKYIMLLTNIIGLESTIEKPVEAKQALTWKVLQLIQDKK